MTRLTSLTRGAVLAGVVVVLANCTLEDGGQPALLGPSEFGLSVTLTASPDVLPRDGASQSVVIITVRDDRGAVVAGQRLALGVGGPTGTALSTSEVTTERDGRARVSVTAPTQAAIGASAIVVSATPVALNSNFANTESGLPRTVTIALTGEPNTGAPVPSFIVTPATPEINTLVEFNASATTDEGVACQDRCTYAWNFDNGATATGRIVTQRFTVARDHTVTLAVRDPAGSTAELHRVVAVSAVAAPTVSFTMSPSPAIAGQTATFTATAAAAPRHSVQSYTWNWGDGTGDTVTTTPTTMHIFSGPGTFVVSVTARDDLGQAGMASSAITVGSGVTASFSFSPNNPRVGDEVFFNGSASTGAGVSAIVKWEWDFGDGTTSATNNDPTVSHQFAAARAYVVRLTVTDGGGRTAITTATVEVAP